MRELWKFICLCICASLLAIANLWSQTAAERKIFYDKDWKIVPGFDQNGFYRVETKLNDNLLEVKDYYANGALQMSGFYSLPDSVKTDSFVYYSATGKIESEGVMKEGKMIGTWKIYDSLGNISAIENYMSDLVKAKSLLETDTFVNKSQLVDLLIGMDAPIEEKWNKIGGVYDGICTYYYPNGKVLAEEIYKNGRFFSVKAFDTKGAVVKAKIGTSGSYVEPRFKVNFSEFINDKLRYPAAAKRKKLEGVVFVKFLIKTTGLVANVQVVDSTDPIFNDEAIRLIRSTIGYWYPGYLHQKEVDAYLTLPIRFVLK